MRGGSRPTTGDSCADYRGDTQRRALIDQLCVYEHNCLAPVVLGPLIERPALLRRVADAPQSTLLLVTAPAGSGKTVALTQIGAAAGRDVVWVSVEPRTAAPMRLLQHIAVAQAGTRPLPHTLVGSLLAADTSWGDAALPRLLAVMRRRSPFVLCIDNAHHLVLPEAIECLEHLAAGLPEDALLVVASRRELPLRIGPLHRHRAAVRISGDELAFSAPEVAALGRELGVVVGKSRAESLTVRTGGWAAAVSSALQAMRDDDRAMLADASLLAFVEQEFVELLPAELRQLLTRTSILDRMSGSLADEVAATTNAAEQLRSASDAQLFVVATEPPGWYRCHPVVQHILRRDLGRDEAETMPALHRRATAWFEANGDVDRAIAHARAAGELQRAGALVFADAFDLATSGHTAVLGQRLAGFENHELAACPCLCLSQAILCMSTNRPHEVESWIGRATTTLAPEPLSDGTQSVGAAAAYLRALVTADAGHEILASIGWPDPIDPTVSSLSAAAVLLAATLQWMMGEPDVAVSVLRGSEAGWVRNPTLELMALAYLALLLTEAGDTEQALYYEARARQRLRTADVIDSPIAANPLLALAVLDGRAGRAESARKHALPAQRLLAMFGHVAPRSRLFGFLLLAEMHLQLGELDRVAASLASARPLVAREQWASGLRARCEDLGRRLRVGDRYEPGVASLTPAERRVLEYLPTHLSLREIGIRTYRSSHTIKSQTVSLYRKLGVNTRSEAVRRARELRFIE